MAVTLTKMQDSMNLKKRKDSGAIAQIQSLAMQRSIQVKSLTKHVMNTLADQRPHQGVLADCSELQWAPLKTLPVAEEAMAISGQRPPVWLALDQVSDPVCCLFAYSASREREVTVPITALVQRWKLATSQCECGVSVGISHPSLTLPSQVVDRCLGSLGYWESITTETSALLCT
jgi:hypothetical protein